MYIALSSAFSIRNEASTSFLIRVQKIIDLNNNEFGAFCIPPFMGYILSHIGDYEYGHSINAISDALKVSPESIDNFVQQLIENPENKQFKFSDTKSVVLPSNLLKKYSDRPHPIIFEDSKFNGLENFVIARPTVPLYANFMVTIKCTTDCIYCYANRKLQPTLKTDKILAVIKELHDQGTINLTLTGGDIFAHPDWHEILKCVRKYGYKPYISTKTPLGFDQIKVLRNLGYEEIQFSLDSTDPEILRSMINVDKDYINKVSSFLEHCSELGLNVIGQKCPY